MSTSTHNHFFIEKYYFNVVISNPALCLFKLPINMSFLIPDSQYVLCVKTLGVLLFSSTRISLLLLLAATK